MCTGLRGLLRRRRGSSWRRSGGGLRGRCGLRERRQRARALQGGTQALKQAPQRLPLTLIPATGIAVASALCLAQGERADYPMQAAACLRTTLYNRAY